MSRRHTSTRSGGRVAPTLPRSSEEEEKDEDIVEVDQVRGRNKPKATRTRDFIVSEDEDVGLDDSSLESAADNKRTVDECVQFLLIANHKRLPIKRAEIAKQLSKKVKPRLFGAILDKSGSVLERIYGVKLVEVPDKGLYILINMNKNCDPDLMQIPKEENIRKGILLPVLGLIHMTGNAVAEDVVWKFLKKLGLDIDSKDLVDGLNETVKELMTQTFVRQLYLKYTKETQSESTIYSFDWGFRAQQEVSKMEVLQFVCRIYGDTTSPQSWRQQYKEALSQQSMQEIN